MAWLIRKVLQIIIILCVLLAIGAIAAFLFVSPNNFRGKINQYIQDHTGYQIEAKGHLDWSLGTKVVLRLSDVTLVGPQGFSSPFLSAKQVDVALDLFSMFKDNLVITKLDITEMVAVIEKQATGLRNIDGLKQNNNKPQKMTIRELNINDSTLLYQNEQSNRHWAFNNLSLKTNNLTLFPSTNIEALKIKTDVASLDYNVAFNVDATVNIDAKQNAINFDPVIFTWHDVKLSGKTSVLQYNNDPQINGSLSLDNLDVSVLLATLNANAEQINGVDIDQIKASLTFNIIPSTKLITVSEFLIQLGDGTIKGDSQVALVAPYKANFNVTANKMNIIPLVALTRGLTPLATKLPGVASTLDLFKNADVAGKFAGTEISLSENFKVDHFTADLKIAQGKVQLGPITAKAYESSHNINIDIDVNELPPKLKLIQKGDNIVLENWIKILNFPPILTGNAGSKVSISASGYNLMQMKESASGQVNLSAKNGTMIGLDIEKLQKYSVASINDVMNQLAANKNLDINSIVKPKATDWASTQKSSPVSTYETFDLSAEIQKGTSNTTIKVVSPTYDLSGTGTFNLATNQIKFDTQISNKELTPPPPAEIASFVQQAQIPLAVGGSLSQIEFNPDLQNYIVNIIKQAQDTIQKKAVASMVAATGPDAKTDKTAEQLFVESIKGIKQ